MDWLVKAGVLWACFLACAYIGKVGGRAEMKSELKQLQTRVEICETGWKTDIDLFNLELCENICKQKDVK